MFFKKKKIEEVKEKETFVIPQIISPYKGLKKSKDKFKESVMASPMVGTGLHDKPVYNDSSETLGDIGRKYDSYRNPGEKKVSDEELINKYGTKFPEFQQISESDLKEVYGENFEINKKDLKREETTVKEPSFSFIESLNENKKEEVKETPKEEIKEENTVENNENPFNFDSLESNIDLKESNDMNNNINKENRFDGHFNKNGEYSNANTSIVRRKKEYNTQLFNVDKKTGTDNNTIEMDDEYKAHYNTNVNMTEKTDLNRYEEVKQVQSDLTYDTTLNESKEEENNEVSYTEPETLDMPLIVNPYKDYKLPPLSLLIKGDSNDESEPEGLEDSKQIINDTLTSFGINGQVEHYVVGPTFTRFEVSVELGTNVKKIPSISDTLQMNLGVTSIRIQAPIPGKKTIGIEVPNLERKSVAFSDTVSEEFVNDGKPLNVALGKDIDGNIIYSNIAKWPHGLIAGSTGSGKSVSINTIIVSILLKAKPDEVKFLMIDPKQVELSVYNDIPHLITPVISDAKMASKALDWAVNEMEKRFTLFLNVKARDITSYNERVSDDPTLQKIPYIVIVIDEMADLMMQCGQEVEASIQRIAQKARAAGIHLLCATQRPTVDVIKGTIKANIQARVAFRVNSYTDSMTILDEAGAESLLGRGDMLLKEVDQPRRVQGSFIQDEEIDKVVEFIQQESEPHYLLTHQDLESSGETNGFGGSATAEGESQTLMYEIAKWCCENQSCSINLLQRNFNLGFNRAQNIVNALEEMGIVSEKKGTKRDILMSLSQIDDLFERGE